MTTTWDPQAYDRDFAFVAAYGAELLDWLDVRPRERVLDLGCGTGELTARIAAAGAAVVGMDSDEAMVAAARQRLPEADLRVVDAHDFTLDEPVDAVFSNAALHWMPAAVEVLGCVSDVLRPGGRFVAEMGAKGNVETVLTAVDQACREAGYAERRWPWFFPSPAQYAAMLEDTGLEIQRLDFRHRPTQLPGADGFIEWLGMFAGPVTRDVPRSVLERAAEIARPALWRDGAWWADYRRLRFLAVKTS